MQFQYQSRNTYTVVPCRFCDGIINNDPDRVFKIVEKNGEPLPVVAQALIKIQVGRVNRPYYCAYCARTALEFLDLLLGIKNIEDAKAGDLETLAFYLKNSLGKSNNTLKEYAKVMNHIFNQLVMSGYTLHPSLYSGTQMLALSNKRSGKNTNYTLAGDIILLALDKQEERENRAKKYDMPSYNKHLEKEVIELVMAELQLLYRCIFAVSLDTGYRISSTLSILMKNVNFNTGFLKPSHSKTGIKPELVVSPNTLALINRYITNDRARVIEKTGSTSPYLFLTQQGPNIGKQVTDAAYYAALKRAQQRVMKEHPELGEINFASHAARATRFNELDELRRSGALVGDAPLSDHDIKQLIGWSSLSNVPHYEKRGAPAEMSLLITEVQEQKDREVNSNEN